MQILVVVHIHDLSIQEKPSLSAEMSNGNMGPSVKGKAWLSRIRDKKMLSGIYTAVVCDKEF